jgi:hypothetical protein
MTAQSFASHCSEKRRPLSSQQAEEIVSVLRAVRAGGAKPSDAVRLAISQGWTTIKLDWLQNAGMQIHKSAAAISDDWSERLRVWTEDRTWASAWGPKPGEPKCQAPPELLQRSAA